MMVVWRKRGTWEHREFLELPEILSPEHFLVVNNSRVFPARLWAHRPGIREAIEVLLLRESRSGIWDALLKPARKAPQGQVLQIADLSAQVIQVHDEGRRSLSFDSPKKVGEVVDRVGHPPLPPYIRRRPDNALEEDRHRYQTVYAQHRGSVAAPTAGLHFTTEILNALDQKGIPRCEILLHVGYGTFQPIRATRIEDHRMEPEYYEVSPAAAEKLSKFKNEGRRLVAVGTTTTRTLEYIASRSGLPIRADSGWCDLFIYPGFEFRVIDSLLTNFHLPGSTLLLLVCAFAGRDLILECYKEAVSKRYRFYSYGDCMLIL